MLFFCRNTDPVDLCKLFVKTMNPEDLNIQDNDGCTPLHYAARKGFSISCMYLLKVSAMCDDVLSISLLSFSTCGYAYLLHVLAEGQYIVCCPQYHWVLLLSLSTCVYACLLHVLVERQYVVWWCPQYQFTFFLYLCLWVSVECACWRSVRCTLFSVLLGITTLSFNLCLCLVHVPVHYVLS
jgi:hypothetical protein